MRLGFFVPFALLSMTGWALAQSQPATTIARVVPSGKARQIGYYAALNPDCSSAGDVDARVIKQPKNGTVEVEPGTGFSTYIPQDPRAACNSKQSQGIRIKYTSKDGFIGKDAFDVELLTPGGGDLTWKFSVEVK